MPLASLRPSPLQLFLAADDGLGGGRLRASPSMLRLRFRVYVEAASWEALPPWEKYLCRVHAYAQVTPDAVFCLESASALWGLPLFGEPRDIHVFNAHRTTSTRYGDVVVHTSRDDRAVTRAGSLSATARLDTALDLGRVLPPAFGLAVADAMAHESADPHRAVSEFQRGPAVQVNTRGRRRLQWLADRIDASAESPGESVSRATMEWLGYPAPELQHVFTYEGVTDRTDFFWPEFDAIGESDGWGKYSGTAEEVRRRLHEEKVREDRLRRHLRAFGRWDWKDTMRAEPLDQKLAAMGLPRVAPRHSVGLATLRQHPRSLSTRESAERMRLGASR